MTLTDFVPEEQQEKLGIIEDVAMFTAPAPGADGQIAAPSAQQQIDALEAMADGWASALDRACQGPVARGHVAAPPGASSRLERLAGQGITSGASHHRPVIVFDMLD